MTIGILGGGIAGLSLAANVLEECVVLEKEDRVGGLCRSFAFDKITYDIGPHIVFSKHEEVLNLHNSMVEMQEHKRLNRILLHDSLVTYPFENSLGSLPPTVRDKCLHEFLNNPYKLIIPENMQQFFLNKFGEGMTDAYFFPYNKKIWKFDPSYLDLQMVERIPNPPPEDVISGANGKQIAGYTHQAIFTYPESGGFESIVKIWHQRCLDKGHEVVTDFTVRSLERFGNEWNVVGDHKSIEVSKIVSTLPLPLMADILNNEGEPISDLCDSMMYNSIYIVILKFSGDRLIDQFALYVPDEDVIFHRLTRLNFLGKNYGQGSGYTYFMAEITFRPGSYLETLDDEAIVSSCLEGLQKLKIVTKDELVSSSVKSFPYAYVIYDKNHRERTDKVLSYLKDLGIICHGRFGKFEYQNSDQVVFDSLRLASELNMRE